MIAPFTVFSQKKIAIQPLPAQKSSSSLNNNKPEVNAEYEKALKEYEVLIKKYPDKKELYYNLGNLNYLSGDAESALKNYRHSLIDSDPQTKAHTLYNMGNTLYQLRLQWSILTTNGNWGSVISNCTLLSFKPSVCILIRSMVGSRSISPCQD